MIGFQFRFDLEHFEAASRVGGARFRGQLTQGTIARFLAVEAVSWILPVERSELHRVFRKAIG